MGKYRLQIHIAKPGPFPASALNVRRNGEKRADFTAVQLTNKDCYELDDNYKIRDVFDPLDTVRVVGHQDTPTPKPPTHNLLKRKVDKGPAASASASSSSYADADARSTSSTPAPESGIEGESKKQRKKRRKAEEAAAKAAAAVASSGLFANGAIDPSEDFVTEEDSPTFVADPSDSTPSTATVLVTVSDSSKGKAVVDKGAINMDTTGSHKAEQEKATEEMAKLQKQAEELARKEAEEKKRKAEEAKRQREEQKAKKEAEDKARKEAEDKARKEAEDKARKDAEDKARKDAEDKAKKEAEDEARKEAEVKAKALAAEEEKKRRQEEKAQKDAEKAKAAEEKARKAAEAKEAKEAKRKAAEETKARLAEEKARKAAELKEAKRVATEEKKQQLAEERAAKLKENSTRRASQSEQATGSDAEVDQLLSSPEPTDFAPSEDASSISVLPLESETLTANEVHNEDSESSTSSLEFEERPRRKSMVVVEIAPRTAPSTSGTVNRLAPGTVPDFLTNAAEDEVSKEVSSTKAVSDESAFTTATEHPLSPKKRGRPPKVKPEAAVPVSPAKPASTISTPTKPVESHAPLADAASDPESEQELEVFSFFKEQRLKGQQPPPVINTPKPVSSAFSFEPYHSTPPQRLTDKPTMASDSESDSDASGPDYDAPPSMPPMILSSRPSISVPRLRPESPRGLAISMPKVSPSKPISNVAIRREETYDSGEDAFDNSVLTEEEEDEPLVRTRKVVLPGVLKPMALVKEEAKENEDEDATTKDEKDELQETSEESGQSDHNNSSDDDSTSSDSESESESESDSESEESEESGSGVGSRSSEDQEAVLVKTEPPTNGSRGGGGVLSGLLSLQGAGHGSSNNNSSKPTVPARTSFFSLTDISAKMGLPVTSLAELTAQGRAKKIGSIGSAIASPASSASSGRKAMSGMNGKGVGSSSDESSDDEAESDSDDNTDSSDEEGDAAKKAKAGPQIKIAGKKRRSSTKSASGGSSGRKKGRLDALF
ncbi:hypothetical protein BGZ68_001934 [Mortierella alpina]|nr:hypothetical protein BGZ68_001934 [Mortierella alpina]